MKRPTIAETDYPSILSWSTDSIRKADRVYGSYNEVLASSLMDWDDQSITNAVEELQDLPPVSLERVATAPDTYQRLIEACHGRTQDFARFLNISTAVEKARIGRPARLSAGRWSATGDCYIADSNCPDTQPPLVSEGRRWHGAGAYEAPLLGGLPIDSQSILARRPMAVASFRPVQYGDAVPLTQTELHKVIQKLTETFAMISSTSTVAANFISRYAKTVVLRNDPTNPDTFQSSSCNGYIGQIVLLNAHLPHVDHALLAESLVHEAIHALMWRAEILSPIIKDATLTMATIRSPWSGAELHYYTLLQACYVWFGIAMFWKAASSQTTFPSSRVATLMNRATSGFAHRNFLSQIDVHAYNLSEGMRDAFDHLAHQAEGALPA